MLELQALRCHNINLVTPSHVVPQILEALPVAIDRGLRLPLVYNSSGYDSVETLRLLDGVIDIYMPDLKFTGSEEAERYTGERAYPEVCRRAIEEMHRQVGDLVIDEKGLAVQGLLVRHLVLPEGRANTFEAMKFLAEEISRDTFVNLMAQFHPAGESGEYAELSRGISGAEFEAAIEDAKRAGIQRLDSLQAPLRYVWF
jgi:putative pyruvate formate lyase activating enzyme